MDATVVSCFMKIGLPLPAVKTWEGVSDWITRASNEALEKFSGALPDNVQFDLAQQEARTEIARRRECVLAMVKRAQTRDPRARLIHDLVRKIEIALSE